MQRNRLFIFALLCFLSMLAFVRISSYTAETKRIYAGTAKIDYTPDSVPDSLILEHQFIRVIAFSDGEKTALIIASELKWVRESVWEAVTKRIKEETGIEPEYVLFSGVHTHSDVPPGDDFNDKIMICVKKALSGLEPVSIGAGKGECLLNMNRRDFNVDSSVVLGRNPYAPCDHEIAVLRIDNERREPVSIMVNWPCHAVINFPSPRLFSGDWPGATAKFVENEFQNKIIVPVTIGASGDINPLNYSSYPPGPTSSQKKRELAITAKNLGEETLRVSGEIVTYSRGKISAVQRYLSLPGIQRLKSWAPNPEIVPGDDLRVRLTAIKVGNIVFAGYGGEVMTEIGMSLKKLSPYSNTFVVTHCNGSCGYLVTDKALKEGGLEAGRTRGMPGTEKALVNNMLEMINELK